MVGEAEQNDDMMKWGIRSRLHFIGTTSLANWLRYSLFFVSGESFCVGEDVYHAWMLQRP